VQTDPEAYDKMYTIVLITLLLWSLASAQPKILICSDSTTANYSSTDSNSLQGWGYFLHDYMSIPVINLAKNGRSTRSFIREGLWKDLLARTSVGDFVVIEMGHNDVTHPSTLFAYADEL
jgi:rhamnogalacturonan acetylesterase